MPRLAEIKSAVQETQADILINAGQLPGSCESAKGLAQELKGWVYLTETPSDYGPDHKIAVVKQTGSNCGLVIDVTQDKPFVGNISSVQQYELVAQELEPLMGVGNWKLMLDYSR